MRKAAGVKSCAVLMVVLLSFALTTGACNEPASSSSPLPGAAADQGSAPVCEGAISWEDASQHVGELANVRGPVVSTHYAAMSNGEPTFLNVGRDYPDAGRLTIVVWGEDRANFSASPEDVYEGANICVRGTIETYEGLPEIILRTPSDIAIEG